MIHDEIEAVYKVERCRAWIQHKSLTKVALQFPDHLLPDSAIVTARLQARVGAGVRLYILGDTTDGQCCVDEIRDVLSVIRICSSPGLDSVADHQICY